jgi:catechol 2,3-dioxygenase-like lactoylglutathione lyase family enzyme
MNYELQLIQVPVSDVDASIEFYEGKAGFNLDHDHRVSDTMRFVQMTPLGSACSISFGTELGSSMAPGSLEGLPLVVADADAAPGRSSRSFRRASAQGAAVPRSSSAQARTGDLGRR